MRGERIPLNGKTMRKTQGLKRSKEAEDELLPEYRFDYRKAQPNRFAGRVDKDTVIVVLDPDVSKVFSTQQAVNNALRALITAMPTLPQRRTARH